MDVYVGDRVRPRRWVRLSAMGLLAILLLTLLVACGGDGDDDGDDAGTDATKVGTGAASEASATGSNSAVASPTNASTASPAAADDLSGEVIIFAAASLTDVFEAAADALTEQYPDLTLTFNFAGSQALVTQMTEGAPADVFASANTAQMTAASESDLIGSEPQAFTRNRLAIIVPADNPAGIEDAGDLANDGLKLVLANPDVPVGQYARDIFAAMSADAEYGPEFATAVEDNVVSQESSVRDVVTKVQLGEADAGVVYVTDVTADVAEDVAIVEIPEQFNIVATYPIALTAEGDAQLGQAFIDYILSDAGQALLLEYGFTPLD